MSADLGRIAFVSRRYAELGGLGSVVVGVAILFWQFAESLVLSPAVAAHQHPLLGVVTMAGLFAAVTLEPRYRGTFGQAVSKSPIQVLGVLLTSLPLMLMFGVMVDALGEGRWTAPSAAAAAVGLASALVLARDRWWRPHYVVPFGAAVWLLASGGRVHFRLIALGPLGALVLGGALALPPAHTFALLVAFTAAAIAGVSLIEHFNNAGSLAAGGHRSS